MKFYQTCLFLSYLEKCCDVDIQAAQVTSMLEVFYLSGNSTWRSYAEHDHTSEMRLS